MIVHGGTIATLTALLAARQARADFDVWRDGAHAGPPLALLASDQAHYSTARAAQIMGFGEPGAIAVESDERFRMRPEALAAEIAAARGRGLRPIAVVATAGTTPTGAFDPLAEIADICAAEHLWLHVDAAHGGSAALSPSLAPQLAGIERADSVVWDLHKTLPFPALASLLAYARARDAYGAFAQKADYLFRSDDPGAENMGTRTLECTRPQLALVAYLGFAAAGADGMRAHVERLWELGAELAEVVRDSGDFELALEPECNIVCFRHRAPAGVDSDAHQERIRGEVNASGSYYLVQTRLRGATWLRSAVMNAATTRDDLLGMLAALRASAARL
jgi:L-2,4-diaminobutyrate decarboxylase